MLPLTTPRLELRDFRASDFDAVHAYASDPEVVRYMPWGPNDARETRDFLARCRAQARARPRHDWGLAVVRRDTGALVGGCGVHLRRPLHRDWELGYVLARPHWGHGIAREAAAALVAHAFERLGAHRVFATVDPAHAASVRLLRSLGFQLEGHQRADTRVRGQWRDSLVFARRNPADEGDAVQAGPDDLRLEVTTQPDPADVEALGRGLTEHAAPVVGTPGFRPLAVLARDGGGLLRGGCSGRVNWNWLDVSLVWVDPALRGRGLGARLLGTLEEEARRRGCTHAHLDTFRWQAAPFYRRLGYEVFATLEDYPPGQQRLYLRKSLGGAPA